MIIGLVITNLLLDHSALVPVALLLIAVVCVGIGYLLLRGGRAYAPRIRWGLVTLSLLPVVVLTLVPTSRRVDEVGCTVQFSLPTLGTVELLANLALFFPPVFFATLATRRPLPTLAAGAGLSAAIEAFQAVLPGIGRSCDTNDWAMNTTGALFAILLAGATMTLVNRASVRQAAQNTR
jgi:hypothetical protein